MVNKSFILKGFLLYIKNISLRMKVDGSTPLQHGRLLANKGQLTIYNRLLSTVTGYYNTYAFILGRSVHET